MLVVGCGAKDPTPQNQSNVKEPVGKTNQTDFPERTRRGKWISDMVIGTENRRERLEENSLGKRHLQIYPEGGKSPKCTVWQVKKKIPILSDKYPITHDFIQMYFKIIISSTVTIYN